MENSRKPEVLSYEWLIHENTHNKDLKGLKKTLIKNKFKQIIEKEHSELKKLT